MSVNEEERINDILQELLDTIGIDETLLEDMKSMGGQLPRLYGLPKVHKPEVPIPPVLSMPSSPYYKKGRKSYKVVVDGSRIQNQLFHKENRRPSQGCDSRS